MRHPKVMALESVPDLYPVGARVRMFPDVVGVVVAVRGERRVVETTSGRCHEVRLEALQEVSKTST